jgi:hypothetical protein
MLVEPLRYYHICYKQENQSIASQMFSRLLAAFICIYLGHFAGKLMYN